MIKVKFIRRLHILQINQDLKFVNKHIHFTNYSIMNVQISAQTLSSEVNAALETLSKKKDTEFVGAEAKVKFIR